MRMTGEEGSLDEEMVRALANSSTNFLVINEDFNMVDVGTVVDEILGSLSEESTKRLQNTYQLLNIYCDEGIKTRVIGRSFAGITLGAYQILDTTGETDLAGRFGSESDLEYNLRIVPVRDKRRIISSFQQFFLKKREQHQDELVVRRLFELNYDEVDIRNGKLSIIRRFRFPARHYDDGTRHFFSSLEEGAIWDFYQK